MVKIKVAVATPRVYLANVDKNLQVILGLMRDAAADGAKMIVFPPHALTGSTCGALFSQNLLADAEKEAFKQVKALSTELDLKVIMESTGLPEIQVECARTPAFVTRHPAIKEFLAKFTSVCRTAYIYCPAGYGESTADAVYAGGALVYCCGHLLAEGQRFQRTSSMIYADIDTSMIPAVVPPKRPHTDPSKPHPFIPDDKKELAERCEEILKIQTMGLVSRLEFINCKTAVIGISGGLDSTLAVLVTCLAFDELNIPRTNIIAVTMPGYGTTSRTRDNALVLMEALGLSTRIIPITPAVSQHFKDIEHDPAIHNATYENAQARERTQILMDIANDVNGIVIGTGDMSEIALGWCTYNGDHMSMYGVNGGVPKTVVKELVRYCAETKFKDCGATLLDIVDTPISPELLPGKDGEIDQKTEDLVGPYELHDYFLYYFVRQGMRPSEILAQAKVAFEGKYDDATIEKWLRNFVKRFFSQQFKRSCSPEGARIGSVSLSPRGAWPMPSDASSALWLDDIK